MAFLNLLTVHLVDGLGFLASGATLCAFAQKRMLPMRLSAIAANVFFIGYGALGPFYPVLMLHVILLPLNIKRLTEQQADQTQAISPVVAKRYFTLIEEWRRNCTLFSCAASNPAPEQPLYEANSSSTHDRVVA
jgi:hypothetical protein